MDASAIVTYVVLFTSTLLFVTPVFGSNYPYTFILDVGNADQQKTTLQQTLLSVTGGSMSYRYPASGYGGVISHTNVAGKDYGSDLTAVITNGGPGYRFIELTVIGQDDIPYQVLVTVEGQKNDTELSVPDSTMISDGSNTYGSVPSGSAIYEETSYRNDDITVDKNGYLGDRLETHNQKDLSNVNKQYFTYIIQGQTDEEKDISNQSGENYDDGVLPSSEIGDEMYPDEPRFNNVEQNTDSLQIIDANNVGHDDEYIQSDSDDNNQNINLNTDNVDEYDEVEENNKVALDNTFDSSSKDVGEDKEEVNLADDSQYSDMIDEEFVGDSNIENNNETGDENDIGSRNQELSNDIDVNSGAEQSDEDSDNVFTSYNKKTNSYLVSNNPYTFWDMNTADPKINEVDSVPQDEYKLNADFAVREKKASERDPWDEDELPDPALYQRYKVLKPHLYGDVQMGPHGERQDLNASPHWTNDMQSDSLADEQIMQSHNAADNSREDDDGSYDNDDVSAVIY